ncbi:hypothetical protein NC651_004667 [Populus alba x Populus x berolinensis]|nr:hypothetical protein NC651_004667 [Populus alba x Populus x berolinensis]
MCAIMNSRRVYVLYQIYFASWVVKFHGLEYWCIVQRLDSGSPFLRFKSSLSDSDDVSGGCGSKRKLPGHVKSVVSSTVKGIHDISNPELASLNLPAIAVPSLFGLCTRVWGLTPSDLAIGEFTGKPVLRFGFIYVMMGGGWVDLLTFVDKCEHAEVPIYQVILITVGSLC